MTKFTPGISTLVLSALIGIAFISDSCVSFAQGNATKKPAAKKATRAATPTRQVLNIMKRYKRGVTIAKLKERSGLSDKQISNILHRASKSGKISRVSRGVYTLA